MHCCSVEKVTIVCSQCDNVQVFMQISWVICRQTTVCIEATDNNYDILTTGVLEINNPSLGLGLKDPWNLDRGLNVQDMASLALLLVLQKMDFSM